MRRKLLWSAAATILTPLVFASVASATDYYFSPTGSDNNSGTSQATPFASLSALNNLNLNAGDNVYLQGGASFSGTINLGSQDTAVSSSGVTAGAPIRISTYGSGYATINAGSGSGITATNNGNIEISNLKLVGSGSHFDSATGKYLYNNTGNGIAFTNSSGAKNQHISVNNVITQNFGGNGIWVGATGQGGYNGVSITNVVASGNQMAGIAMMGDPSAGNRSNFNNVYVGNSIAANNYGKDGAPSEGNSGNGIVLGQVTNGTIEKSVAYGNGVRCASTQGGAVGIWAWDSANIVIQKNASYDNGTAGPYDGGGFDLDGGVINSVMQYNYSHDNAGAGFLLAEYSGAKDSNGNTIRFNISQNDARKNDMGAIHVFGDVNNANVYNNTVVVGPSQTDTPSAIKLHQWTGQDLKFLNNLLMVQNGSGSDANLLSLENATDLTFARNAYYDNGGTGNFNPSDLQALYLTLANDPALVGLSADAPTVASADQLANLVQFSLTAGSPLIDQGQDLLSFTASTRAAPISSDWVGVAATGTSGPQSTKDRPVRSLVVCSIPWLYQNPQCYPCLRSVPWAYSVGRDGVETGTDGNRRYSFSRCPHRHFYRLKANSGFFPIACVFSQMRHATASFGRSGCNSRSCALSFHVFKSFKSYGPVGRAWSRRCGSCERLFSAVSGNRRARSRQLSCWSSARC